MISLNKSSQRARKRGLSIACLAGSIVSARSQELLSDEERLLLAIQKPKVTALGRDLDGNYATIEFKSGPNLGGQYRLACYAADPALEPARCADLAGLVPQGEITAQDLPKLYGNVANNVPGLYSETVDCYVWADGVTGKVDKCQFVDRVDGEWDAYLANNGVTVKCPGIDLEDPDVNPEFVINGMTYRKRAVNGADGLFAIRNFENGALLPTSCTTGIQDMRGVLSGQYNAPIGSWDTSDVVLMDQMFSSNYAFDHDISQWNTSAVESMKDMFAVSGFSSNIGSWDVSSVKDFSGMFLNANFFNADIGNWNTSSAETFANMFLNAGIFNADIGGWDTSNVKTMNQMFTAAPAFNANIGAWDTSNVEDMVAMFAATQVFNQDLSAWPINSAITGGSQCGGFDSGAINWVLPRPNLPAECIP